ncbi:hypothetical protein AGDE_12655 [Angomonas deanei]|uniref:Regulator of chromosome condensation (RCC1) repeat, putative n=1 Tax=Angomonas deanei TaxID=59799 RepID=A0A7G2C7K9_9TRYP|nr:hypothetical protein AGDE_12655 [Angomonas deanei]CAD2215021.1 Regulator of chromosome condensation (RCC1) repeat, putative [Angomonas deanei]|eukprot:EPY23894.1 hypothetical protein AGDE_12655 [Angomonas deanei]
MISDAEFWIEVRRKQAGGDAIFRYMAAALHIRQTQLDSKCGSLDREEFKMETLGCDRRDSVDGKIIPDDEKRRTAEARKKKEKELKEIESSIEANKSLKFKGVPNHRTQPIAIRVLQQIMMFAVPIYSLRYNVPAMSMSWSTSCFIDRTNKQLTTFGAGQGVKVPQHLCCRGCVAGDSFFAILTDNDEVWASGGLKVSSASINGPTPLGREEVMTGVAGRTLMLVGHGPRLASVTRAFTVRPLSALSNPTRSIIPSRHVRFLDIGYKEDYYMVGTDSIVYKTNASKRSLSTPRRVMTLCRTPVSRVASGTSFVLIIDQNGHLHTLGKNKKGQLGNGERQEARRKPYFQKSLTNHYFVQVAAGDCHSLALTSNGIVYGAGCNESGQLGLGPNLKEVLQFTPIALPSKCVGIAAGPAGSMFACEDGQVLTCGMNDRMQLGLETTQKIVFDPTPVSALQAGVESYTMDFGGYRRPDSPYQSDEDKQDGHHDEPVANDTTDHPLGQTTDGQTDESKKQANTSFAMLRETTVVMHEPAEDTHSDDITHPKGGKEKSSKAGKKQKKEGEDGEGKKKACANGCCVVM